MAGDPGINRIKPCEADEYGLPWHGILLSKGIEIQVKAISSQREFEFITKEFKIPLKLVGFLGADEFQNYIHKLKSEAGKQPFHVFTVRMVLNGLTNKNEFEHVWTTLSGRSQVGVVQPPSSGIKDFYIMPYRQTKTIFTATIVRKNDFFFTKINCKFKTNYNHN